MDLKRLTPRKFPDGIASLKVLSIDEFVNHQLDVKLPKVKDGVNGLDGAIGAKGDKGDSVIGPQGLIGMHGPIGPRGEKGEKGLKGDKGDKGDQGIQGAPGQKGESGEQGPIGLTGAIGPSGDQGRPGVDGKDGKDGLPPEHEWEDTKLRFKNPDGTWGDEVDLRGPGGTTRVHSRSFGAVAAEPAPATSAPKLIAQFATDVGTLVGDLIKITGDNTVANFTDNSASTVPNGIFGVVFAKPSVTLADVIFIGIMSGYTGLTIGSPIFLSTSGGISHTIPTTGVVQQIGFAVSTTEFFVQLMLPTIRS